MSLLLIFAAFICGHLLGFVRGQAEGVQYGYRQMQLRFRVFADQIDAQDRTYLRQWARAWNEKHKYERIELERQDDDYGLQ